MGRQEDDRAVAEEIVLRRRSVHALAGVEVALVIGDIVIGQGHGVVPFGALGARSRHWAVGHAAGGIVVEMRVDQMADLAGASDNASRRAAISSPGAKIGMLVLMPSGPK